MSEITLIAVRQPFSQPAVRMVGSSGSEVSWANFGRHGDVCCGGCRWSTIQQATRREVPFGSASIVLSDASRSDFAPTWSQAALLVGPSPAMPPL